MRFTPLVLTGLFALTASAQSTTSSASAPLNSEQAAIIRCIEACQEGDVSCTSKCIAVPNPSEDDVRLLLHLLTNPFFTPTQLLFTPIPTIFLPPSLESLLPFLALQ